MQPFTNTKSYAVRVGDQVLQPGESTGKPAAKPKTSKATKPADLTPSTTDTTNTSEEGTK